MGSFACGRHYSTHPAVNPPSSPQRLQAQCHDLSQFHLIGLDIDMTKCAPYGGTDGVHSVEQLFLDDA
jgi:hypothetical protein